MPHRGDRRAPVLDVKNDPASIPRFFDEVRLHGTSAGITEQQMITWARFYAPAEEEALWRLLPSARGFNFTEFRDAALAYYPNAITRYTLGDLQTLVRHNAGTIMLNTAALGEYHRNFQRISAYLISARHISDFDSKRLFREGIHVAMNQELEHALRFVDHDHPVGVPWDIDVVLKQLHRILAGGQISAAAGYAPYGHVPAGSTYAPAPYLQYPNVSISAPAYAPVPPIPHPQPSYHPGIHPNYPTYQPPQAPQPPPVKQEDSAIALLIKEVRDLRLATEKSALNAQTQNQNVSQSRPPQQESRPLPDRPRNQQCIMCGSSAHYARACATRNWLLQKGAVRLNDANRLILPDGSDFSSIPGPPPFIDKINRYFQSRPNELPGGISLPIQVARDVPPHMGSNMMEAIYTLSPTSAVQVSAPPPTSPSPVAFLEHVPSAPPVSHSAYNDTAISALPADVNLFTDAHDSPETNEVYGIIKKGPRPLPRKVVFDGVVIPDRPKAPAASERTPDPPADKGKRPNNPFRNEHETTRPTGSQDHSDEETDTPSVIPVAPAQVPIRPGHPIRELPPIPKGNYRHIIPASDTNATDNVFGRVLDAQVSLSVKELMATSPDLRRKTKDYMTARREAIHLDRHPETALYSLGPRPSSPDPPGNSTVSIAPALVPLRELDVWLDGKLPTTALLDSGSTFLAMPKRIWRQLGSPTIVDEAISVETADGTVSRSVGLIPRLRIDIGSLSIVAQVQVMEHAPFDLLLGRPFYTHTRAQITDESEDEQTAHLTNPDTGETFAVPTRSRTPGKGPRKPGFRE